MTQRTVAPWKAAAIRAAITAGELPPWTSFGPTGSPIDSNRLIVWTPDLSAPDIALVDAMAEHRADLASHTALGLAAEHAHPYEPSGTVATHAGAGDPHPGYLTAAEGDAAYSAVGHSHAGGGPTIVKLTSPAVSAVTAFANIPGFVRALAAGEYVHFRAVLIYRTNATTTGIRLGVNGPAAPAVLAYRTSTSRTNAAQSAAGATDNETTFVSQTYDAPAADSGVAAAATDYIATIEGVIQNGPNAGNLAMRFASEVAVANGVTLRPGSFVAFTAL